jgi:hypothetical protein
MILIYFSYFHSVLSHGIIFLGNSVHTKYIFKIQKRTIRTITNAGIRDSFRDFFKKWQILPFYSQYNTHYSCLKLKIEVCLNGTQIFMDLIQDMIRISTCLQQYVYSFITVQYLISWYKFITIYISLYCKLLLFFVLLKKD